MNHEPILEALAAKPRIRSVDIADKLDTDTGEIEGALLALIKIGHVVSAAGVGANDKPTVVYSLSDTFLTSDAAATLRAKALVANFRVPGWDTMSRADKAIAFIRAHGTASSAQLHVVMGLLPEQYASVALSHVITSNRLARDGKNWRLGSAADAVQPIVPFSAMTPADVAQIIAEKRTPAPVAAKVAEYPPNLQPAAVPEPLSKPERELAAARELATATAETAAAAVVEKAARIPVDDAGIVTAGIPAPAGTVEVPGGRINPATMSTGQLTELYSTINAEIGARSLAFDLRQGKKPAHDYKLAESPEPVRVIELPAPDVEPEVTTRFAIWSDGMFEVQRNGQTALLLNDDELSEMVGFIAAERGAA